MTKILNRINETGTLLVEAIAILGLISMATPVLYKKAAERSAELQDINASSQLRAISSALDSFIKDNFAKIARGDTDVAGANFSAFAGNVTQAAASIDISTLNDYLPYGMMDSGAMRATKLFDNTHTVSGDTHTNTNYKIVVRLNRELDNGQPVAETLTGFVIAKPKDGMVDSTRAARIASMVGSNGGLTETVGNALQVNGNQGIWSVTPAELNNLSSIATNTLVVSSLEPISSQGFSNENVLYRVDMQNDNDQELNSMTTDLFMGTDGNHSRNIRMVNQIVMTPDTARMVGSAGATGKTNIAGEAGLTADVDNALYIGNFGGANVQGALQAVESLFTVRDTTNDHTGSPEVELTGRGDNDPTLHIDVNNLTYGNPNGTMIFDVTANNLIYKRRSDNRESLNVAENTLEAMDHTLLVDKTGNDGYVTIGTGGTAATQHIGNGSPYTWANNVATEGTFASQDYRLTVDGSVFAKDTVYAGKVKGFDGDVARLRAGSTRDTFDASNADNDFFMKTEQNGNAAEFSLRGSGHDITNALIHASSGTTHPGLTVNANNVSGEDEEHHLVGAGIDLIAGNTAILDASGNKTNAQPQSGEIRLGAGQGIYLSTHNTAGHTGNTNDNTYQYTYMDNIPVSIQETMLQVYKAGNSHHTVDTRVDRFYAVGRGGLNNNSQYKVEGMEFDIGRIATDSLSEQAIASTDRIAALDGSGGGLTARSILNIQPDNYGATTEYGRVTTRITGGVGVYDYDADISTDRNNPSSTTRPAALFVDKGKFEIRSTSATVINTNNNPNTTFGKGDLVLAVDNNMDTNHYANNNTANYGSVYIRRGGINLDTNRPSRLTTSAIASDYSSSNGSSNPSAEENFKGYIAADRFISNYSILGQADDGNAIAAPSKVARKDGVVNISTNNDNNFSGNPYNKYEVNPTYTSIMHDIKLTTRGGARLSEILPDFINKGIYIVDTSYREKSHGGNTGVDDWTSSNFNVDTCKNNACDASSASDVVSAYVGFVPTPKCPPGYAKVITLTPAGWAMAQAGKLTVSNTTSGGQTTGRPDVEQLDPYEVYSHNENAIIQATTTTVTNPDTGEEEDVITHSSVNNTAEEPLYLNFQKNTWLRSEVRPVYNGNMASTGNASQFNGWGLIMGFIYPASTYGNFAHQLGLSVYDDTTHAGAHSTSHSGSSSNDTVYWNLFPVYNNEIEGYATVYCYFDRNKQINVEGSQVDAYDDDYVDKYDQLSKFNSNGAAAVNAYSKDDYNDKNTNGYKIRLNDQRLKYNEPW